MLWCFGVDSNAYHCTLATVIGEAPDETPTETNEESTADQ